MKSSIKLVIFIGLLAALFVIAACASPEGGEEGAIAGQAYGGAGGGSGSSVEVKACADTGTSVTYTKLKGGDVTKADECAAGNKRKDYSCSTISGGTGKRKQSKTYLNTYTMPCGAGTTCSNGVCVAVAAAACGNNMKEGTEVCDGTDLGGAGCNTQTKDPSATGTLKCYSDCTGFDTSLCAVKIQTENVTIEIAEVNKTTTVTPPAMEICDGADNNNDGKIDEGCDDDNDDWCDKAMSKGYSMIVGVCPQDSMTATIGMDCNDANAAIKPGAIEICANGIDENCNGQIDEIACLATNVTNATTSVTNATNKTNSSSSN